MLFLGRILKNVLFLSFVLVYSVDRELNGLGIDVENERVCQNTMPVLFSLPLNHQKGDCYEETHPF